MKITLKKLLEGKSTKIKNKTYLTTFEYIKPFIDKMSNLTNDFIIYGNIPQQITVSQNKDDITYNKVLIQAIIPNKINDQFRKIYCLSYGLDLKIPLYKIYNGYIDSDDNMYIFDCNSQLVKELLPNKSIESTYLSIDDFDKSFISEIEFLKNTYITGSEELFGTWITKCVTNEIKSELEGRVKLSVNDVIKVYVDLFIDEENKKILNKTYSLFEVYKKFSELITKDDKDILNKFNKSLLINRIIR